MFFHLPFAADTLGKSSLVALHVPHQIQICVGSVFPYSWMLGWPPCTSPKSSILASASCMFPFYAWVLSGAYCSSMQDCFPFYPTSLKPGWTVLELGESYYQKQMWTKEERFPPSWCPGGTSLFCQYPWGGAQILISTSKLNTEQLFPTSAFLCWVLLLFLFTKGFSFPLSHLDRLTSQKLLDLLTNVFKVQKVMLAHVYTHALLKHLLWTMTSGQFIEMFYSLSYGKWSSPFTYIIFRTFYEVKLLAWTFLSLIHHFSNPFQQR